MWSLRERLHDINKTNDLPDGFHASAGIRSLFPPRKKGPFSIRLLDHYRYLSSTGEFASEEIAAVVTVTADGAGRWKYVTTINSTEERYTGAYGVGFLFDYSIDRIAYGYMTIGTADHLLNFRVGENPDPEGFQNRIETTVQGFDQWIAENWPDIFANNCEMMVFDASHIDDLSTAGDQMATKNGFSGLRPLAGASVSYRDVSVGGGSSGSEGGGIGINLPPPDDDGDEGGGDDED